MERVAGRREADQAARVEMFLAQLETLPTLNGVALRLLELTTDDNADAREVVATIKGDPSLAARVLRMCQCSARTSGKPIDSIDRAVLLLGFTTVRAAVLSTQVFDAIDGLEDVATEAAPTQTVFDRRSFWYHSLAVSLLSEKLAATEPLRGQVNPGQAYVAGLLHGLGKLVLHLIVPKSFDEACTHAIETGTSLARACDGLIGIDPGRAGRLLAEHWRLPEFLRDVMWIGNQPLRAIPDSTHRRLVAVVSLADALASRHHFAALPGLSRTEEAADMARELDLAPRVLDELPASLQDEVLRRAVGLGVDERPSSDQMVRAIGRANDVLGRIVQALRERCDESSAHEATLTAISMFQSRLFPAQSVAGVLAEVARSAREALEARFVATLHRGGRNQHWQLNRFSESGRPLGAAEVRLPEPLPSGADGAPSLQGLALLSAVKDLLAKDVDVRRVHALPLPCGSPIDSVILHTATPEAPALAEPHRIALTGTWAAAITNAVRYESTMRLADRLVEANRDLVRAEATVARSRVLATLGEVAAGAAHEMNNPLTVISGRAQILAEHIDDSELKSMARQIATQAHHLSDLITALRSFSEPVEVSPQPVDVGALVDSVVTKIRMKCPPGIDLRSEPLQRAPRAEIDADLVAAALEEVLDNAIESPECDLVEVVIQFHELPGHDGRWKIQVLDNGIGMTESTLAHAFDPFFSVKSAGRSRGLGLARARRLIEAHEGEITLANRQPRGAVATIRFPHACSRSMTPGRAVA